MDLIKYAKQVDYLLQEQEIYFKTRNPEQLRKCKALESELKQVTKQIIAGDQPDTKQTELIFA